MSVNETLSFNNEVFRVFITWGGLLLIKMLLMSVLTSVQRFRKGAYENPEDVQGRENVEIKKDEDVERVRRAHMNDLENIPAFLIAALFYVMSEPNIDLGSWLIRIGVLARFSHTIVRYLIKNTKMNLIDFIFCLTGLCDLSNSSTSSWNFIWYYSTYHTVHDRSINCCFLQYLTKIIH